MQEAYTGYTSFSSCIIMIFSILYDSKGRGASYLWIREHSTEDGIQHK